MVAGAHAVAMHAGRLTSIASRALRRPSGRRRRAQAAAGV